MARKDTHLDHLARVPLFAACSRRELQKIAKASDEVTVPEGKVLVEQGTVAREAFVIVKGRATVKRGTRKVATLSAGDYFGELALLDRGSRTATVVADSELTVLVLGSREFTGILDEVPLLARKLLSTLAGRVRDLDAKAYG